MATTMRGKAPLLFCIASTIAVAGCEKIPDHCADYELACIGVTVDSGPADVRRLRVNVMKGLESSTVLTPKKPPKEGLVYPLRFAIRFGRFDNVFSGEITFETIALNDDFDVIGQTTTLVNINGTEKKTVSISLEAPTAMPDMSSDPPDLRSTMPDLNTDPPDLTSPDLTTTPDMP
jgi:hypothetical protein